MRQLIIDLFCIEFLRALYENFTHRDPKSTRNMAGVQMVGVFIANKMLPWRPDQGVDKDR